MRIKILKEIVTLDLFSRFMIILLNFQSIAVYYEKNLIKNFQSENLPRNRSHHPYHILKVSSKTRGLFSRCWMLKKMELLESFVPGRRIWGLYTIVNDRVRFLFPGIRPYLFDLDVKGTFSQPCCLRREAFILAETFRI